MMSNKESSINEIRHLLGLVSKDNLDMQTVAFTISKHVVAFDDEAILDDVPLEAKKLVIEIAEIYKETGEYKVYSGVGCADHSEMAAALSAVLTE